METGLPFPITQLCHQCDSVSFPVTLSVFRLAVSLDSQPAQQRLKARKHLTNQKFGLGELTPKS